MTNGLGKMRLSTTHLVKPPFPVDPKLPKNFDDCRNEDRPRSHQRWWFRPYIMTCSVETWERHYRTIGGKPLATWDATGRDEWVRAWPPAGTRYDVRCLDGGAWDRSTWWGSFGTLEEAIACCAQGKPYRYTAPILSLDLENGSDE